MRSIRLTELGWEVTEVEYGEHLGENWAQAKFCDIIDDEPLPLPPAKFGEGSWVAVQFKREMGLTGG